MINPVIQFETDQACNESKKLRISLWVGEQIVNESAFRKNHIESTVQKTANYKKALKKIMTECDILKQQLTEVVCLLLAFHGVQPKVHWLHARSNEEEVHLPSGLPSTVKPNRASESAFYADERTEENPAAPSSPPANQWLKTSKELKSQTPFSDMRYIYYGDDTRFRGVWKTKKFYFRHKYKLQCSVATDGKFRYPKLTGNTNIPARPTSLPTEFTSKLTIQPTLVRVNRAERMHKQTCSCAPLLCLNCENEHYEYIPGETSQATKNSCTSQLLFISNDRALIAQSSRLFCSHKYSKRVRKLHHAMAEVQLSADHSTVLQLLRKKITDRSAVRLICTCNKLFAVVKTNLITSAFTYLQLIRKRHRCSSAATSRSDSCVFSDVLGRSSSTMENWKYGGMYLKIYPCFTQASTYSSKVTKYECPLSRDVCSLLTSKHSNTPHDVYVKSNYYTDDEYDRPISQPSSTICMGKSSDTLNVVQHLDRDKLHRMKPWHLSLNTQLPPLLPFGEFDSLKPRSWDSTCALVSTEIFQLWESLGPARSENDAQQLHLVSCFSGCGVPSQLLSQAKNEAIASKSFIEDVRHSFVYVRSETQRSAENPLPYLAQLGGLRHNVNGRVLDVVRPLWYCNESIHNFIYQKHYVGLGGVVLPTVCLHFSSVSTNTSRSIMISTHISSGPRESCNTSSYLRSAERDFVHTNHRKRSNENLPKPQRDNVIETFICSDTLVQSSVIDSLANSSMNLVGRSTFSTGTLRTNSNHPIAEFEKLGLVYKPMFLSTLKRRQSTSYLQSSTTEFSKRFSDRRCNPPSPQCLSPIVLCNQPQWFRPPRCIIFGHICSGKTTLAKWLCDKWSCPLISPTSMVQKHLTSDTPLGSQMRSLMLDGHHLNDRIVFQAVRESLCSVECITRGYVLEDFPTFSEDMLPIQGQLEFIMMLKARPEYIIELQVSTVFAGTYLTILKIMSLK
ncbi:hypothetical protein PHET_09106 [Paragonimus heterotremus]|uniref:Uncharacterized protein n=2 Tax=Paragonimus heterotremus TaxID=100268 RepID=A0A8J4T3G3_9TREM|nr:hypothetical protein PHET_09106 [Paragonimus heterotremus]